MIWLDCEYCFTFMILKIQRKHKVCKDDDNKFIFNNIWIQNYTITQLDIITFECYTHKWLYHWVYKRHGFVVFWLVLEWEILENLDKKIW